jgi:hypothetical protein
VLLQGWPQHPLPFTMYSLEYEEDTNTIVYTALEDIVPDPPAEPGIKQMHLILNGFTNPAEGEYWVTVEAETGPDGAVERGWGRLHILPMNEPSINITSVFNEGTPNTIYQQTGPGEETPLAYDFLLWDEFGDPLTGVTIEAVGPNYSRLVQDDTLVGHVFIDAPADATGHVISAAAPSEEITGPVMGIPTARLTAQFTAGSAPGWYVVTFKLTGGNAVDMFVYVADDME